MVLKKIWKVYFESSKYFSYFWLNKIHHGFFIILVEANQWHAEHRDKCTVSQQFEIGLMQIHRDITKSTMMWMGFIMIIQFHGFLHWAKKETIQTFRICSCMPMPDLHCKLFSMLHVWLSDRFPKRQSINCLAHSPLGSSLKLGLCPWGYCTMQVFRTMVEMLFSVIHRCGCAIQNHFSHFVFKSSLRLLLKFKKTTNIPV